MTKKNPRKEYNPYKEAIEILSKSPRKEVENQIIAMDILSANNIKLSTTTLGRARSAALKLMKGGEENGTTGTDNMVVQMMLVAKTAKQVGGLENLIKIVNLLEKLKGI